MKHTIKSLRALLEMTQADLAIKIGVSLPTLIKWEQSGETITLKNQKKIVEALQTKTEDIDWKI